jgi:hypothetical protein
VQLVIVPWLMYTPPAPYAGPLSAITQFTRLNTPENAHTPAPKSPAFLLISQLRIVGLELQMNTPPPSAFDVFPIILQFSISAVPVPSTYSPAPQQSQMFAVMTQLRIVGLAFDTVTPAPLN